MKSSPPTSEALGQARAIVAAFEQQPSAGAVNIGGRMFDRPHLTAAKRVLARAAPGTADRDNG
jgi:citrate lyase subunit beta/citryl-CoA lyase